ncbi:HK97 family phage prohead protease [Phenylobacterium sp.]|uniref:HK97 family phage prohead protease n=1 Tax=Phenylobacterium sp. TaxID=1871053 RepID=UPI0025CB96B6|nr:HK97 family phage prohead protease [Phenylobacterium sp.]MBX3482542.1 HK97 family phage prohead protease [Phenylobacterium sp.]MCW5758282.1 HK97 family phage prohead protease [Phenylobacterium sp.]
MDLAIRGYSLQLNVEKVAEEGGKRIVRGMATTPAEDRMGDTINPLGAKFTNPVAWLWQHKHDKPWGWVKFGKPTKAGIPFEAEAAQTDEPGELKDFLDNCWQQVKLGLVRFVSIGFRALKWAWIGDYDGIEFQEIEIYELSAVTIPANPEAVITEVSNAKAAQEAAMFFKHFQAISADRPAPPEDTTDEPAAPEGKQAVEPVDPAKPLAHVAKLNRPAPAGAPFVIRKIHHRAA